MLKIILRLFGNGASSLRSFLLRQRDRVFAVFSIFIFFGMTDSSFGELYRDAESRKLSNGVSVVFLTTNTSQRVYITLCISAGRADDKSLSGSAEIVGGMFKNALERRLNQEPERPKTDVIPYIGRDQTLFSFYGKIDDVQRYLRTAGEVFSNFEITDSVSDAEREKLISRERKFLSIDKNALRKEALNIFYGELAQQNDVTWISSDNLSKFRDNNYSNNRVTILIAGNVDKEQIVKIIEENFQKKNQTKIIRSEGIQEAKGSSVRLEKCSRQVKVPIVEMHWKIPSYRIDSSKAAALDIFLCYLKSALKNFVHGSVALDYSFWPYEMGCLKISITLNQANYKREAEEALLQKIREIAANTSENFDVAKKELVKSSNVFHYQTDVIDTMNWMSEKLSAGYEYEFLKGWEKEIKSAETEKIHETAAELFNRDPDVISVLKSEGDNAL